MLHFSRRIHLHELLGHSGGGTADVPNAEPDVLEEIVHGQLLTVIGEGGGEHQRLAMLLGRHAKVVDDLSNEGFPLPFVHLEHSVGLIKDKALNCLEVYYACVAEVPESSGRRDAEVAALGELPNLGFYVFLAVDPHGPVLGPVEEFLCFFVDLNTELSRGREDEGVRGSWSFERTVQQASGLGMLHHRGETWDQEGDGLATASLRTAHHISACEGSRNGVLLDRGWGVVLALLDVVLQCFRDGVRVELKHLFEGFQGLNELVPLARHRDWHIIVEEHITCAGGAEEEVLLI
mmetsp:Transcript_10689/g.23572  ORF Transcript_10689/g.23572 Transcript_10689/m.23572 type:complete len:292 (+) Transcript_10689:1028-1903(+)